MNELIRIEKQIIGEEEINAVDARELHELLDIKTHYSTWIQRQIDRYGFVINSDFSVLETVTSSGGDAKKDYIISIDMGKELSMVERNDKGRAARKYFIAMEKKANNESKSFANRCKSAREQIELEILTLSAFGDTTTDSKIRLIHSVYDAHGLSKDRLLPLPAPLPVVDNRPLFTATELLNKNNCGLAVQTFHKYMLDYGFMEIKQRRESKRHPFTANRRVLCGRGLDYGKNVNPSGKIGYLAPRYYEESFMDLFNLVMAS